jgi:lipoprotein-releasing system permease protein
VAGLAVGISALLITLFILNGFERVISEKIADFDGHIRVRHYLNKSIPSKIEGMGPIISAYNDKLVQSKFIQGSALLRKGKSAEGVIVEGIELDGTAFLSKILVRGTVDLKGHNIIIGERLANQLNIDIGDNTVLFDIATLGGSKNV